MKRIWLLLLLAVSLHAQNPLYLDLAGEWRTKVADNPAYARPDFDDSGWAAFTLPTPQPDPARQSYRWLRRSVVISADEKTDDLVLTIGGFRPSYEVFVNGVKIGSTDERAVPQARSWPVPPRILRAGETNFVALRSLPSYPTGGSLSPFPNAGPFLLTGRVNAPVRVTEADRQHRLQHVTSVIVIAMLYFLLAILLFTVWLGNRQQYVMAQVTGFLVTEALTRGTEYYYAFSGESGAVAFRLTTINAGLIVFAILDQLGLRRRNATMAGLLCTAALALWVSTAPGTVALYLVLLFALSRFATTWERLQGRRATLAALLLVFALSTTRFVSAVRITTISGVISGYYFRSFDAAVLLLAVVLVILLLRRLLDDRREKQRLSSELEAARIVQQLLLNNSESKSIEAVYYPAQEVGGDFYQIFPLEDGSELLAVGDVSGKGLRAAMVVSLITGALRNRSSNEPGALLGELNRTLGGGMDGGFVTASVARCYPDGRVVLANAGNPAPYMGGAEVAVEAGLPLGILREADYAESECSLRPDQQLTFVSDGVVEAANSKGELFGFARSLEISGKSAGDIAAAAQAWGQNDDITVVTVRRTSC